MCQSLIFQVEMEVFCNPHCFHLGLAVGLMISNLNGDAGISFYFVGRPPIIH
jgi:hypothetical protein